MNHETPPAPPRIASMLMDGGYYRLLEGAPPLRGVARTVAQYAAFAGSRSWRRNLLFNAGLALGPEASTLARTRCAVRMLGAMQQFISEVFEFQQSSMQALQDRVARFDGTSEYLAARRLRRGVVLVGIHMGAFEPAIATLNGLEKRVHVLYQPDHMPRFERARRSLRERLGVIEHSLTDGVAAWSALLAALEADEAVLVHADRTIGAQPGVSMPFLGLENAALPPGPVRLAAAAGAPIVPTFCTRLGRRFRIWAEPMIVPDQARLTAREVPTHPAQLQLVQAMERAIRAHPDQWLALHDLRAIPSERSGS